MDTETKGKFTGCPHGCTHLCLRTESENLQTHINNVDAQIANDNKHGTGLGFLGVKYPKSIVGGSGYSHCLHEQRGF